MRHDYYKWVILVLDTMSCLHRCVFQGREEIQYSLIGLIIMQKGHNENSSNAFLLNVILQYPSLLLLYKKCPNGLFCSEIIITSSNVIPFNIYLLEVNDGNTRTICEVCSRLRTKTSERTSFWCLYW